MRRSLSFLFIFLYFAACNTIIEISLPDTSVPITVNAIFTPDSEMSVELYKAVSLYDTLQPFLSVTNATITATAGSGEVFMFHRENEKYVSNAFPQYGETYEIKVSVPGYPEQINSVTTVPEKKPDFQIIDYGIDTVKIDTVKYHNQLKVYYYKLLYIDILLDDPADEMNIYSINVELEELVYTRDSASLDLILIDTVKMLYDPGMENQDGSDIGDDILQDINGTYVADPPANFRIWVGSNEHYEGKLMYLTFNVIIREINEDYYSYIVSANVNENNYHDILTGPVRVYSNIQGGTGIFGACTSSHILKDHPDKKLIEENSGK